jgi:hypothetical protein
MTEPQPKVVSIPVELAERLFRCYYGGGPRDDGAGLVSDVAPPEVLESEDEGLDDFDDGSPHQTNANWGRGVKIEGGGIRAPRED